MLLIKASLETKKASALCFKHQTANSINVKLWLSPGNIHHDFIGDGYFLIFCLRQNKTESQMEVGKSQIFLWMVDYRCQTDYSEPTCFRFKQEFETVVENWKCHYWLIHHVQCNWKISKSAMETVVGKRIPCTMTRAMLSIQPSLIIHVHSFFTCLIS